MSIVLGAACATGPSHLPPPHDVPGAVIGGAIGNARYEARRNKVKAHIAGNLGPLTTQIASGVGPALTRAFTLARVPEVNRAPLLAGLRSDPHLYIDPPDAARIENLTVAFMVHGD